MLSSIRNQIVLGSIVLILIIQMASGWIQSQLMVSSLFNQFISIASVLSTQYYSQSMFTELGYNISSSEESGDRNQQSQIHPSVDIFMPLIQDQLFRSTLNAKEDLKELMFLTGNKLLARSYKEKDEIKHEYNNQGIQIKKALLEMASLQSSNALEVDGNINIFVPFVFDEKHIGGIIMVFSNESLASTRTRMLVTTLGLTILFVLACGVIIIVFTRRVLTNPIKEMIASVQGLAEGDLHQAFKINKKNEIGEMGKALNNLSINLREIISEISEVMGGVKSGDLTKSIHKDFKGELNLIKSDINDSIRNLNKTLAIVLESSRFVEASAQELSGSAENLSSSTSQQASTLEEISSTIVEVEHHSKKNADSANEAKKLSLGTMDLVNKGGDNMKELQSSMNEISATSSDVKNIIKVIDEIAFQTNLLALNAAVEAARAGKYGKGFAVVAEEVRNLASRSAEAAKNTSSLIESSLKNVNVGVANAEKTGAMLEDIVKAVTSNNQLVSEIAEFSLEQNTNIGEITTAISQVNGMIQNNSAIAEETASVSVQMLDQAKNLQKGVAHFSIAASPMSQPLEDDHQLEYEHRALLNSTNED